MRITALKTHYRYFGDRNWIITEMQTDEGLTGFSEVGKNRERAVVAMIQEFEPYLLGRDPTQIEALWEGLYRLNFWTGATEMTALSAVEMCMWDILGKSLGAPVYKLLGGPVRERIRLYAHVYPDGDFTPEGFAAAARNRVEQGYTALKVTVDHLRLADSRKAGKESKIRPVFREGEALSHAAVDSIRHFLGAIREAVGNQIDLMVDCHGRFAPADAVKLGSALDDVNLLFLEEPCPPENVEALAQVSRALRRTRVASGERLLGRHGFWELLKQNAVAVVQPDIANTGGLAETKKIAAMAEVNYMTVAPHNPNGPLAIIQNVHLSTLIPNFLILETLGSPEHWKACEETLKTPLVMKEGCLDLPTGAGWGVDLDLEALARSDWKPPAHF